MPAVFNLELVPGQHIALDTTLSSEDQVDLARMEDGTTVDGVFWGKLEIIHESNKHEVEFTGTRLTNVEDLTPGMLMDSRVLGKLAIASKPPAARCHLSILSPMTQHLDVHLTFSEYWDKGVMWPIPVEVTPNRVRYELRVNPGGALEMFDPQLVVTSLYYEAM
jgi:hypothetical protein